MRVPANAMHRRPPVLKRVVAASRMPRQLVCTDGLVAQSGTRRLGSKPLSAVRYHAAAAVLACSAAVRSAGFTWPETGAQVGYQVLSVTCEDPFAVDIRLAMRNLMQAGAAATAAAGVQRGRPRQRRGRQPVVHVRCLRRHQGQGRHSRHDAVGRRRRRCCLRCGGCGDAP